MAKRFESVEGSSAATHVCKSCLLLPGSEDIAKQFEKPITDELEKGETPGGLVAFRWGLRALLAYRNGNAKQAAEYLEKAEEVKGTPFAQTQNLAIRALVEHSLGKLDDSRDSGMQAKEIAEQLEKQPSIRTHQDLLIARILLREFETTAKSSATP